MAFRVFATTTKFSDGRVVTEGPGKPKTNHARSSNVSGPCVKLARPIGHKLGPKRGVRG